MSTAVSNLMLQFLDWVATSPRTYADAMAAWRTSCPRLSIWEDALLEELVQIEPGPRRDQCRLALTPRGQALVTPRPA
jgi:hypothetical protein